MARSPRPDKEWPEWLIDTYNDWGIGQESARDIYQYFIEEQGLGPPETWARGRFEVEPDSLTIYLWDNKGEEFSLEVQVPNWEDYDWPSIFDIVDLMQDFIEVEWDRYDKP
jgi:CRISPR/Cas system CSM-associated protein Csm4 (group 5 of RAMP superfamily)